MAMARPQACATVVASPEPATPRCQWKMNSSLKTAFVAAMTAVTSSVTRGRPMPLKNPSSAQTPAPKQEPPTRGSQNAAARSTMPGGRPNGDSSARIDRPARQEQRRRQQQPPERDPHRLRGARLAAGPVRLRDHGLHGHAESREHEQHDEGEPVDRADGRERARGNAADEPDVGQVQHQLDGAVGDQRQCQRDDGALVDVRAPRTRRRAAPAPGQRAAASSSRRGAFRRAIDHARIAGDQVFDVVVGARQALIELVDDRGFRRLRIACAAPRPPRAAG